MEKLSLDYIAGLLDSDGSFSISVQNRSFAKTGRLTPQFIFVVNFRQIDKYKPLLEDLIFTLNVGKIYHHSYTPNHEMLSWQTTQAEETYNFCKLILPYLHIY